MLLSLAQTAWIYIYYLRQIKLYFRKIKTATQIKMKHKKLRLRYKDKIDMLILSKTNLSDRSSKVYRHALDNFTKFSQSIDSTATPKYLRWKFNLDSNLEDRCIIFTRNCTQIFSYFDSVL